MITLIFLGIEFTDNVTVLIAIPDTPLPLRKFSTEYRDGRGADRWNISTMMICDSAITGIYLYLVCKTAGFVLSSHTDVGYVCGTGIDVGTCDRNSTRYNIRLRKIVWEPWLPSGIHTKRGPRLGDSRIPMKLTSWISLVPNSIPTTCCVSDMRVLQLRSDFFQKHGFAYGSGYLPTLGSVHLGGSAVVSDRGASPRNGDDDNDMDMDTDMDDVGNLSNLSYLAYSHMWHGFVRHESACVTQWQQSGCGSEIDGYPLIISCTDGTDGDEQKKLREMKMKTALDR